MHEKVISNESKNVSGFLVSMILTFIFSGAIGTLSSISDAILLFFIVLLAKIGVCFVNIKCKKHFSISYCYFVFDGLLALLMCDYLHLLSCGFIVALLLLFILLGILMKNNN